MADDLISREALPHTDLSEVTTGGSPRPVTPGEVLREEFICRRCPLGSGAICGPLYRRALG